MRQSFLIANDPEILKLRDPELYYDLHIAPKQPIMALCLKCGYNKMYHLVDQDRVVCGRCGGDW